MTKVAALYVDPNGPYFGRDDVDPWPKERDAKAYDGPHPVVAHPDCGPWSKLRHMCTKQDESCGKRAVLQVQEFGGVLEHPAHSKLWEYYDLPGPDDATDHHGGRTYAVEQCDWGHKCRKPTWLYVVRVDQQWVMRKLRERRGTGVPTHCISRDAKRKSSKLTRAGALTCRLTPPAFAELLISIARSAGKESRCA